MWVHIVALYYRSLAFSACPAFFAPFGDVANHQIVPEVPFGHHRLQHSYAVLCQHYLIKKIESSLLGSFSCFIPASLKRSIEFDNHTFCPIGFCLNKAVHIIPVSTASGLYKVILYQV